MSEREDYIGASESMPYTRLVLRYCDDDGNEVGRRTVTTVGTETTIESRGECPPMEQDA